MEKGNQFLIGVIILALVGIGGYWYWSMNQTVPGTSSTSSYSTSPSPTPALTSSPTTTPRPTSSPTASAMPEVGDNRVSINKNTFAPETRTIKVGETVTWVNNDSYDHNIVASDKSFTSPNLAKGETYSYTFTKVGSFDYTCGIHPFMKGTIVVTK